jgi:hypothetical protein
MVTGVALQRPPSAAEQGASTVLGAVDVVKSNWLWRAQPRDAVRVNPAAFSQLALVVVMNQYPWLTTSSEH